MSPRRCLRLALPCLLVLLSLLSVIPAAAAETRPDLSRARAVYLYQPENQAVLAAKNTEDIIYPASTVKIMTGLIAVEALQGRYDERVTVTQDMLDDTSGFRMYLKAGETVTVEQMLYAGICGGYNDACVVLSYIVSGSVEAFVARMNARAASLGMVDTVYRNPTGMHDAAMVTTVADTARLALAAMECEPYLALTSTVKYTMAANDISYARTFYNRNALISRNTTARYYHPHVTGMNAGTTDEGGYCVVACAEDEESGLRYLCIVMGADADDEEQGGTVYSYAIAHDLLDHAMEDYGVLTILDPAVACATVPVGLTVQQTSLELIPRRAVTAYLPTAVDPATDLTYRVLLHREQIQAPIAAGETLGLVTVSHGDTLLASVELCAAQDVAHSPFLAVMERISVYTASRPFLLGCGYAALLLLVYFVILPLRRRKKSRKRARFY